MSSRGFADQARALLLPEKQPKTWAEELEEEVCSVCPTMSYQTRVMLFIIFSLIGFFLNMGSLLRIVELLDGNPMPFAVMYTLGNIVSILSTCFLFGPYSQLKEMAEPHRIATTAVFFTTMGVTLFLVFYPGKVPARFTFLVIAIVIQTASLVWWNLSYIPYARKCVCKYCVCPDDDIL
mmetsp:Transcript_13331/g.13398  ORF Transcript_13331/g.13398 Transcript_13331/m.13398 type:complete len:179 (+) Transcript_13331:257-793(+)